MSSAVSVPGDTLTRRPCRGSVRLRARRLGPQSCQLGRRWATAPSRSPDGAPALPLLSQRDATALLGAIASGSRDQWPRTGPSMPRPCERPQGLSAVARAKRAEHAARRRRRARRHLPAASAHLALEAECRPSVKVLGFPSAAREPARGVAEATHLRSCMSPAEACGIVPRGTFGIVFGVGKWSATS